jgi:hypothetical protein
MKIEKSDSINVRKTRTDCQCAISREIIPKGKKSIRFTRYMSGESYGGIWISMGSIHQLIDLLKEVEDITFESRDKIKSGVMISKYNGDNKIDCSYCEDKIEKGEFTLSLSENYSYCGDYARIHKDCVEPLRRCMKNFLESNEESLVAYEI